MTKLSTEKLGEIPETMLITLWAKSEESKFKEPFLIDKRAEEII
jgi:O-methyltransferase domain protein